MGSWYLKEWREFFGKDISIFSQAYIPIKKRSIWTYSIIYKI